MAEEYDRQRLLDDVWREPVMIVAPRYGLSDVGLKKLCSRLQIPTPCRGHWAKLKAGKRTAPQPKLRTFTGAARDLIKRPACEIAEKPTSPPEDARLLAVMTYEHAPDHRISVPDRVARWHPEVAATREALKKNYKDRRGMPIPGINRLDISVSKTQQSRALRIADALFKALEERGHQLIVGTGHPQIVMFGIRLTISFFEPAKRRDYVPTDQQRKEKERTSWGHWPRYEFVPCGLLEIRVSDGGGGSVKESDQRPLEQQLNNVVIQMARYAIRVANQRAEMDRLGREREQLRKDAMASKAIQDAERARVDALTADALRWQQAETIRSYLAAIESNAMQQGGLSAEQAEFLDWAKRKADWLDPRVRRPDTVLDQEIKIPY